MGSRIADARKAKGWTQEQLARESGVSRTLIALLESGSKKNTTASTLKKLSTALDRTVEDLFFTPNV